MASPQTLDFDSLVAPLPGENPAGEYVRYSGAYDAIQEARRADDALPQGEWQRETKTADWRTVIGISSEVLTSKSKDLQIAVWLVEALVKSHGFPGLRDGFRLLRELHDRFWPSFYPAIEGDDLEFRAGPLLWLNEKLPAYIRDIPVTEGGAGENYSWHRWEESRAVDNLGRQNPEAMQAAIGEGKITGEQFDKAVQATPRAYYETLFDDLNQSQKECEQLGRIVDEKFGRDAPSLLAVKKAIEDCQAVIEGIVKKKREQDPSYRPPKDSQEQAAAGAVTVGLSQKEGAADRFAAGILSLEPQSREDAFRRLAAIADYLKKTEPLNPVAYLVERAVQWTKMPLEEWLGEVIRNEDVLGHLRDTLGIKGKEGT